ncbi:MAG: DUF2842 domain-containing protein [Methyloligellaceae bacterium]
MNIRYRKLVGLFILLAFLFAYMVVASWIGATYVNELGGFLGFFYYFFAGILWIIPAGALIRWMQKP